MKRIIVLFFTVIMVLSIGAHAIAGDSKALIIYYDYSENILTDGLDVDAISQASMAGTLARDRGNLLVMKDILAEHTGADVYALHVAEPYAPAFEDMMYPAQEEKENDVLMSYAEELPDLSGYDRIYFGTPVWWYGAPQAVLSYLQQVDMSGKEIVFFGIHRGSGFGGIPEQIEERQPNATIIARYTVECQTDNDQTAAEFNAFLDTLE